MRQFLKKLPMFSVCAAFVCAALFLSNCYLSINGMGFDNPYASALQGVWEIKKLAGETFPKTEETGGVRYTTKMYMYVQSSTLLYSALSKTDETTNVITVKQKTGPIFYRVSKRYISMNFPSLGTGKKTYELSGNTIIIGNSGAKDALVAFRVANPSSAEIESWQPAP